ncbi:uncharacterized protein J7T54_003664 [Emericellopsis cladophorae]|uniref:Cutinase n=1 Tax=Emericellopsis cladophorae TaxID=2686198 RepID=A0A9P9Y372_9HYPO|nr:uncharacterized protein J7T54_003664 [Emericellopsis cladophorae]KAI6782651.1 hypothetical protein J7T54_003664 [Emericellopsis cladophorae]
MDAQLQKDLAKAQPVARRTGGFGSASHSSANKPCNDVHIFLARDNNEPTLALVGRALSEGAANGVKQIAAYNKRCPDAKLVVSGYSQGGQVVGYVLGDGAVVAAMILGNVRHTAGHLYVDLSMADSQAIFPRPEDQLANLARYGDALHNYCVETDPICKREAAAGGVDDEDAASTKASSTASKTASKTKATETSTSTSLDAEEETASLSLAVTSTVATDSSAEAKETASAATASTVSSMGAAEATTDDSDPERTSDEDGLATGTRAHLATLGG